jgi:hypothetical protein
MWFWIKQKKPSTPTDLQPATNWLCLAKKIHTNQYADTALTKQCKANKKTGMHQMIIPVLI